MNDEEYINMRLKEGRQTEKPVYKLRASDFIPIVGMINRIERQYSEKEQPGLDNEKYFIRNAALTAYNFAFLTGLGGLAALLVK